LAPGLFGILSKSTDRAKQYCEAPFETRNDGPKKEIIPIIGESVQADFTR